MDAPTAYAIGVDIGGTKIAFALIDPQGRVVAERRAPTLPAEGVAAVLDRLAEGIAALGAHGGPVAGVGVGCPGNVHDGVVRLAVNLGWSEVRLRDALRERFPDLPIAVSNDAAAVAIGEWWCGAARGCPDVVYAAIGTGLGGAAMSGGRLVRGASGAAMEIGHLPAVPGGRLCACGLTGCTEQYASGVGLLSGLAARRGEWPDSLLARKPDAGTADILDAMRAGDPLALALLHDLRGALTQALVWCAGALNAARIVIGGGLGRALGDLLDLPGLESDVRARLLPYVGDGLHIVPAQLASSAVGAGCLVWAELGSSPPGPLSTRSTA
ncbi:MAG: ROK family protein [Anaerolineae bacterium]|nr:ROK family protein [Anaerolineae bacterium]